MIFDKKKKPVGNNDQEPDNPAPKADETLNIPEKTAEPQPPKKKNTIVIVDDDRVTLKLLEKALIKHGLEVYTAQDGVDGYEMVQKVIPDILITDMLIPKIHGIDLCKKIKNNDALKNITVILITAVYKFIAFKDEIVGSGANYYIKKPITMKKLLSLIDNVLNQ